MRDYETTTRQHTPPQITCGNKSISDQNCLDNGGRYTAALLNRSTHSPGSYLNWKRLVLPFRQAKLEPIVICAPIPDNEAARLAALNRFEILDSLPQQFFDDITQLAAAACDTPIALISLVDEKRQWFKSRIGFDASQTGREGSFCSHAILEPQQVMVVRDATCDARFHDNPLVLGAPDIRFYAGAPIVTKDGLALGTVCVIDRTARTLSTRQEAALASLARLVMNLLEQDKRRRDEARLASDQAQKAVEYLQVLEAESLDLLSFVDRHYIYRYVNQTFLDYFGLRREQIVGKYVSDVVGELSFRDFVKERIDAALAGHTGSFELLYDYPARGPTHVVAHYIPSRDAAGEIVGVAMRTHSVQALKEREGQLSRSVAMLETLTLEQQRFIHIVSHDLREPINTIVNFGSLLAEDHGHELSPGARRHLDYVRAGGERMKLLLDDLVHFVQMEQHAIDPRPVDLNRVMALVRDDLAPAISRAGARVEWDRLPVLAADESHLRRVMQNLVANGIKFARKEVKPIVRVSAQALANNWEIAVRDNGIGIPRDQLEQIFDMFKRLHSRKRFEGTGLGLSICRKIAAMHGGRIGVASELDQGSCFTLYLPSDQPGH